MRKLASILIILGLSFSASPSSAQELPEKEVLLEWSEPTQRENGTELPPEEIGGYELRYYEGSVSEYESFVLVRKDTPLTSYTMNVPIGDHQFSIAAYDKDGLYSEFINITETVQEDNAPESVLDFRSTIVKETVDRVTQCLEDLNCTVVE